MNPNDTGVRVSREVKDYTHRQKAVAKLKKSNVVFPAPAVIPAELRDEEGSFVMPQDITGLDSRQLGYLLHVINGLLQWYGAVLASAKIDRLTAERVMTFTESKIRMEILSDSDMAKLYKAREDKDAYVHSHELVLEAQDWFDTQNSAVIMAEQIYNDYQRSFNLVSREITRRGNDYSNHNREGNLS